MSLRKQRDPAALPKVQPAVRPQVVPVAFPVLVEQGTLIHLAGATVRSVMFWVPQSGDVGLGVSILSYAGEVRLGIAADALRVPDPENLVAGFERELGELAAHYVKR